MPKRYLKKKRTEQNRIEWCIPLMRLVEPELIKSTAAETTVSMEGLTIWPAVLMRDPT